jgi:hypothetical protein
MSLPALLARRWLRQRVHVVSRPGETDADR